MFARVIFLVGLVVACGCQTVESLHLGSVDNTDVDVQWSDSIDDAAFTITATNSSSLQMCTEYSDWLSPSGDLSFTDLPVLATVRGRRY